MLAFAAAILMALFCCRRSSRADEVIE